MKVKPPLLSKIFIKGEKEDDPGKEMFRIDTDVQSSK
jgi:hypothetical protein